MDEQNQTVAELSERDEREATDGNEQQSPAVAAPASWDGGGAPCADSGW